MKRILTAAALALATGPAWAETTPAPGQLARIDAALTAMNCEVDHDNVEMEGDTYDLDDVICADGQYDMKLDASFEVTERRKE